MTHEPEFSKKPETGLPQSAKDLAAVYAKVFLGNDDGKRVLADLRAKFGLSRLVFIPGDKGQYNTTAAALIEGQRQVMHEIENALRIGAPGQALAKP
jgi:hypothetical protein